MQDVPSAVIELRRAVKELGMLGAMLPSNGLRFHLGAKEFWPVYEEAEKLGLRLAAGKVLMDRNAPAALCDTAQSGYDQSRALIGKWHGRGRLLYAITRTLSALGLDIGSARIATEIDQAYDTFYVTDRRGRRIEEAAAMSRLREALEEALRLPL